MFFNEEDIARVRKIHKERGTRIACQYIYKRWGIKLKGAKLRQLIGVAEDTGWRINRDINRLAWQQAGW